MHEPPSPPEPEESPRRPSPSGDEWVKFILGFGYAFSGLGYALRTQRNARVHAGIAIVAILMGLFLRISTIEFVLIFVAISLVFAAEMINTVIELCIDLVSPDYHPLAKTAKDVAAGAVLFNAILAVIIGLFIFGPYLWAILTRM